MNIHEMHILFRTLGQQMGMQLIRGILPESIDDFINDAINMKIRSILIENTTEKNNNKLLINNKASTINSLRTLCCKSKQIDNTKEDDKYIYSFNLENVFVYTSFSVKYNEINKVYNCRIINNDDLENTLNDYCNSASFDYPIISIYNNENNSIFELYVNNNKFTPKEFYINYIKIPNKVKWNTDINESVNCDLPDYLHNEIVEIAVNKFQQSINIDTNNTNN